MQPTDADGEFTERLRQQIIDAFELDEAAVEEAFSTAPGSYGAAWIEYRAEFEAFKAAIPVRADEFAATHTAHLIACGRLPEGVTLRWEPTDG